MDQVIKIDQKHKKKDLIFYLRIQYCRNSSWQGTIQWIDGRKSVKFRSVLELASLINDAKLLKAGSEAAGNMSEIKWVEKDIVS